MKIYVIGDVHLKYNDPFGFYDIKEKINTRTKQKFTILNNIIDKVLKDTEANKKVVFLGDIFDSLSPSEKLKSMFFTVISRLLKNNVPVDIIMGNHDTNLMDIHNFMSAEAFNIDRLHIIKDLYIDERNSIVYAPYGSESKLKELTGSYKYLFGHIELKGYCWDKAILDIKDVAKFHTVINGHYHINDIRHLGSLCVHDRSEIGAKHVYATVDTVKQTVEEVTSEMGDFYKIDCNVDSLTDELSKRAFTNETVVSIKIQDTKEKLATVNLKKIKSYLTSYHKVILDKKSVATNVIRSNQTEINFDIKKSISGYCEQKEKPDMEKYGLQILEKALIALP